DVAVENVRAFEHDLYEFLDNSKPGVLEAIRTKKQLDDDVKNQLTAALKEFKQNFQQGQNKQQPQPAKAENNGRRPSAPQPEVEQPAETAGAARDLQSK
ncbi:MAG: hypothetical protein JO270_18350, partial [Acidobacteriaceae bacterium]|nr:hypothetical protein [Acidobacteriaceae bacterium]